MSPRFAALLSLFVALLAGAGLAALINYAKPTPLAVILATPLVVLIVAGLSTPFWLLMQRRLTPKVADKVLVGTALREGIWSGLYAALLIILRVFGYLDWVMVLVLAALFIMLELFLQQRQQPQQAVKGSAPAPKPSSSASYGRTTAAPKTKRKKKDDGIS